MVNKQGSKNQIDWKEAYNSIDFKMIKRKRFGFVIPVISIFSLLFFVLFVIQSNFHKVASIFIFGWINLNFLYTMALFPLIWIAGFWFTRYTRKNIYPLEKNLIEKFGKEVKDR